jgi:hypothetical protein
MNPTELKNTIDYQWVTVKLIDGTVLDGKINISHHRRVSDFIKNEEKDFVVITECCSLESTDKTVFVNKRKIAYIEPSS